MEKKEKKKKLDLTRKQKKKFTEEIAKEFVIGVICSIIVAILATCITLNLEYAKGDNVNPNLLTVISGWLGFAATAIVGIITIIQNRRYEYNTYKQNRIDNLGADRDILYDCYKRFLDLSLYNQLSQILLLKGNEFDIELKFELEKQRIARNIKQIFYQSLNFMYNYEDVFMLNKKLFQLLEYFVNNIKTLKDVEDKNKIFLEKTDEIELLFTKALLAIKVDLDKFIRTKKDKLLFEVEMIKFEDIDEHIKELKKSMTKETQNGQAKDDVNGQDK